MSRKRSPSRMKIGALEEAAGVSRDTIHFYLRSGLLHRPDKTCATVAYYDDTHLERLRRIRALRAHGLPLPLIRRILDGAVAFDDGQIEWLGLLLACAERPEPARADALPEAARALAAELSLASEAEGDARLGAALASIAELPEPQRALARELSAGVADAVRAGVAKDHGAVAGFLRDCEDPRAALEALRTALSRVRAFAAAARDALVRAALADNAPALLATLARDGRRAGRLTAAPRLRRGPRHD